MATDSKVLTQPVSALSDEVLQLELHGNQRATELFQRYLRSTTYSRSFVLHLIETGRGELGDSWNVRRLATLMLQVFLLGLDVEDTREFDFVFRSLRLKKTRGRNAKLPRSVLKEGYSTRKLPGFIKQFRQRLKRPRCALNPQRKKEVTREDVREFVQRSSQECKLVLGRYMFSPEEVVARIHEQVTVLPGLPVAGDDNLTLNETQHALLDLPKYEAAILRKLRAGGPVFWVADATPSKLNSLVEYPLGTVVLVVKPPGSHFEFELKRAGHRGSQPLRARSHVPPSHRLDGGSMLTALQWEARNVAVFGRIYRHAHSTPAPVSRIVQMVGKNAVPLRNGERTILEFLTIREIYGDGYDEMRKAMAIVVDCFRKEKNSSIRPIPGDMGLTLQFVGLTAPAQAILCGSSSFRLDLVAKYLSADGPAEYFTRGMQIDHQDCDAKRLADDLLDEVLGRYHPPAVEYRDHQQYVAAALAVPRNRARANATYRNLLTQLGTMWGTLQGARGYSCGESFVTRNVGLRTVWAEGEWQVRMIFQDHDNLVLPNSDQSAYRPRRAISATAKDKQFILGKPGEESLKSALISLQRIYRVDQARVAKGQKQLQQALKRAYVSTQRTMRSDPQVRRHFDKTFIRRLSDWDAIAGKYLAGNGSSNGTDWKSRVQKFLRKRGYDKDSIDEHCRALEEHGSFVEEYSFLYRAKIDRS